MATAPPPTSNVAIRRMIHNQVTADCLQYIILCPHHPDCPVDEPYFNALIQLLRTLGHAEPETSYMCMVKEPPGTLHGKYFPYEDFFPVRAKKNLCT